MSAAEQGDAGLKCSVSGVQVDPNEATIVHTASKKPTVEPLGMQQPEPTTTCNDAPPPAAAPIGAADSIAPTIQAEAHAAAAPNMFSVPPGTTAPRPGLLSSEGESQAKPSAVAETPTAKEAASSTSDEPSIPEVRRPRAGPPPFPLHCDIPDLYIGTRAPPPFPPTPHNTHTQPPVTSPRPPARAGAQVRGLPYRLDRRGLCGRFVRAHHVG